MLEQLSIKNVAVIDSLDVTLKDGMTVLTGETGAGKSIIIDSINMILGSRTNKELVRHGTDRAEVQAVFSADDDTAKLLEKNGIECEDGTIIISRRVTSDGKSTARINGTIVTLGTLREVADRLINIHGQHDDQALLTPSKHVSFLDAYAKCAPELGRYRELYAECRKVSRELDGLLTNEQEKLQRSDLLSYQIDEITAAKLTPGEEESLKEQLSLLENAEKISVNAEKTYAYLYDNPDGMSAYDLISSAVDAMSEISELSDELRSAYGSLTGAMYSIEDAAREIRDFGEGIEFDEQALNDAEERLDLINRLKRKYGGSVEDILAFCEKAQTELDGITHSGERADELKAKLGELKSRLKTAAQALSEKRRAAAQKLQSEIEAALHELNMEKALFSVQVAPGKYSPNGADTVEFMIATNPGEDLKPLAKIASGGELSRVMLAIKSILAKTDSVGTLIFDEIDTGVSGAAAQKIADKLKDIGSSKQVICISHLPQLAAAADNHFLIVKDVEGELAKTTLLELDTEGRVRELARIVGGGDAAEEYARHMLSI